MGWIGTGGLGGHECRLGGDVAQDGFDKLEEADQKTPIEITFIDQFGQEA